MLLFVHKMLWTWFKAWWWPEPEKMPLLSGVEGGTPPPLDPRQKIQDKPRTLEELNNIIHYPKSKLVEFKLP